MAVWCKCKLQFSVKKHDLLCFLTEQYGKKCRKKIDSETVKLGNTFLMVG